MTRGTVICRILVCFHLQNKEGTERRLDFWTEIQEELAFILEGEVSIIFENEEFLLREGDTIRILPNRGHKFRNDKDSDVKVLFIKSKPNY